MKQEHQFPKASLHAKTLKSNIYTPHAFTNDASYSPHNKTCGNSTVTGFSWHNCWSPVYYFNHYTCPEDQGQVGQLWPGM